MLNRIAVVLTLMAIAAPAFAQPTGKIVFTSVRNGNAEVCVINADGTGFENLTDDDAYDDQPALSPDGQSVAFTMLVKEPPKPFVELPSAPKGATWAEPLKVIDQVIYRRDGNGYVDHGFRHLFVVTAEGGTPQQLTTWFY